MAFYQTLAPSSPRQFLMYDHWKHLLKNTYFIDWNILLDLGSNFNLFMMTLGFSLAFFLSKLKIEIIRWLGYLKVCNTTKVSDPKFYHSMTPSTSLVTVQQKVLDFLAWWMKETRFYKLTESAEILAFFILSLIAFPQRFFNLTLILSN